MHHKDSEFLSRQAELCIALSRSTLDLTVAGQLRGMAEALRIKAAEWETAHDHPTPHVRGLSSSGRVTA